MGNKATRFVIGSFEEYVKESMGENPLKEYIAKTVHEFLLTEEAKQTDAYLRMGENMDILEMFWGEDTIPKLKGLAKIINKQIIEFNGIKIGRTCLDKATRLSNYHSAGDKYSDLYIVVQDENVEIIRALECFFIDYFMVVKLAKLHNHDGADRGRDECKDSETHTLYVALN